MLMKIAKNINILQQILKNVFAYVYFLKVSKLRAMIKMIWQFIPQKCSFK